MTIWLTLLWKMECEVVGSIPRNRPIAQDEEDHDTLVLDAHVGGGHQAPLLPPQWAGAEEPQQLQVAFSVGKGPEVLLPDVDMTVWQALQKVKDVQQAPEPCTRLSKERLREVACPPACAPLRVPPCVPCLYVPCPVIFPLCPSRLMVSSILPLPPHCLFPLACLYVCM